MMPETPEITCAECRAQLAEYAAGTLPEPTSQLVARHLAGCAECTSELAVWQAIGSAVRQVPNPSSERAFAVSWNSIHAALATTSQVRPQQRNKGYNAMNEIHDDTTIASPTIPVDLQPSSPPNLWQRPPQPEHPAQRRLSAFAALAAVLVLALVSAAIFNALAAHRTTNVGAHETPPAYPAETATAIASAAVKVYFAKHPDSDTNPALVFPVARIDPNGIHSNEPLASAGFAIQQMLDGPTAAEQAQGYYSPFAGVFSGSSSCGGSSSSDFALIEDLHTPTPDQSIALQFCRQMNIASDLDGARMIAMIRQTVLQFSQFKQVNILNAAGNCFDDLLGSSTTCTYQSQTGYPVQVYFSHHPESDNNPTAVFPVTRLSPTLGVATYAIEQLIAGPGAAGGAAGYYSPLGSSLIGTSNCGSADFIITLDHRGTKKEAGTATLQFCRQTVLAGDLTGARITAEITKTLEQFPSIKQVVILNSTGNCFNDFIGTNRCLQ